jgi:hypothetical protein
MKDELKFQKAYSNLKHLWQRKNHYSSIPFGVSYRDDEFKSLWPDFNKIINDLKNLEPELFDDIRELALASPVKRFSNLSTDDLIYTNSHMTALHNEIDKALGYCELVVKNVSAAKIESEKQAININIEGDVTNSAFAVGTGNIATVYHKAIEAILTELHQLPKLNEEVVELKTIIDSGQKNKEEKSTVSRKIYDWLGKVLVAASAKGVIEYAPVIVEKAHKLIELLPPHF